MAKAKRTGPSAAQIKKAEKHLTRMGITGVHGEAAVTRAIEEAKKLLNNFRANLCASRPDLFPPKNKRG
jgi:hypothetical protein